MTIAWIRKNYQVPAQVRGRVRYTGGTDPQLGTITAADGQYLRIRLDGKKRPGRYHPTWCIEYLPDDHAQKDTPDNNSADQAQKEE